MTQLSQSSGQTQTNIDPVTELLALEDLDALEKYRFSVDGIHMWPFIRGALMLNCRNRMEGLTYELLVTRSDADAQKKKEALQVLTEQQIYADIDKLSPSKAMVMAHFNPHDRLNNQPRNLYSWPFEETLKDITLVEESGTGEVSTHLQNTIWHEKLFHIGRLRADDVELGDVDAQLINELIQYLKNLYDQFCSDDLWPKLKNQLEVVATRLASWKPVYMHLIRRVNPRCVVIYNASYGHRSFLVYWLKQLKIPVLELQHGTLTEATPTYRFHNISKQHWFSTYLPDHMLLWGECWRDSYEAQISKWVVGNPLFLENQKSFSTSKKHVLICLVGLNTDICLPLVDKIARRFDNYQFKLRLHPMVRANWTFWTERLPDNCVYCPDTSEVSLYEDLSKASLVITEPSTLIYEATQLGIPTYLLKTSSWQYPIPNAECLLDMDHLPEEQVVTTDREYYFGNDWRSDFEKQLTRIISGDGG